MMSTMVGKTVVMVQMKMICTSVISMEILPIATNFKYLDGGISSSFMNELTNSAVKVDLLVVMGQVLSLGIPSMTAILIVPMVLMSLTKVIQPHLLAIMEI